MEEGWKQHTLAQCHEHCH